MLWFAGDRFCSDKRWLQSAVEVALWVHNPSPRSEKRQTEPFISVLQSP